MFRYVVELHLIIIQLITYVFQRVPRLNRMLTVINVWLHAHLQILLRKHVSHHVQQPDRSRSLILLQEIYAPLLVEHITENLQQVIIACRHVLLDHHLQMVSVHNVSRDTIH